MMKHKKNEDGYALAAVLAILTIISVFLLAAAPSIEHEIQRQKEIEAMARGEEIADAIRQYTLTKGALPTKIDDLLEGLPQGTKKRQILRASAAIDPLSSSGKWKLIRINDKTWDKFLVKVFIYSNGTYPPTQNQNLLAYQPFLQRGVNNALNLDEKDEEQPPGGEDDSDVESSGPFIGVVSRSQRKSILAFYGIERHDQWVFTPLYR